MLFLRNRKIIEDNDAIIEDNAAFCIKIKDNHAFRKKRCN